MYSVITVVHIGLTSMNNIHDFQTMSSLRQSRSNLKPHHLERKFSRDRGLSSFLQTTPSFFCCAISSIRDVKVSMWSNTAFMPMGTSKDCCEKGKLFALIIWQL